MYSPKVPERFIPVLYRLARHRGAPMTALVAEAVAQYLGRQGLPGPSPAPHPERSGPARAAPPPSPAPRPPALSSPGPRRARRRLRRGRPAPGGGIVARRPRAPRGAPRRGGEAQCS